MSYSKLKKDYIYLFKAMNEYWIKIKNQISKFDSFESDAASAIFNVIKEYYEDWKSKNRCRREINKLNLRNTHSQEFLFKDR